jgi:hypothetical protein
VSQHAPKTGRQALSEPAGARLHRVEVAQHLPGEERVARRPLPERVEEGTRDLVVERVHGGNQLTQLLAAEFLQGHQPGQLVDAPAAQQVGQRRVAAPGGIAVADGHQDSLRQAGRERRQQVRLLLGQPLGVLDDQEHRGPPPPGRRAATRPRGLGPRAVPGPLPGRHDLVVGSSGRSGCSRARTPGGAPWRAAGGALPAKAEARAAYGTVASQRPMSTVAPSGSRVWASSAASLDLPTLRARPARPVRDHRRRRPARRRRRPEPASRPTMADRLSAANTASGGCRAMVPLAWWARADLGDRGGGVDREQQRRILAEHCRLEAWRSGPGSRPSSSPRRCLVSAYTDSASTCRPERYRASISCPQSRSWKGVPRPAPAGAPPPRGAARGEGGGHGGLLRDHAELLEPRDSGLGEVGRTEVAQHVAAPECEGLASNAAAWPGRRSRAPPARGPPVPRRPRRRGRRDRVPAGTHRGWCPALPGPGGGQHPTDCADVGPQRGRSASEGDSPHMAVTRCSLLSGRLGLSSRSASSSRARGPPSGRGGARRRSPGVARGCRSGATPVPAGWTVRRPCRSA